MLVLGYNHLRVITDRLIHHITLLLAQGCHSDLAMDIIKISVDDDSIQVVMATTS